MTLAQRILEKTRLNFENEISDLIFQKQRLIGLLEKNKLKKDDREKLIELLHIFEYAYELN